ncbi:MAG: ABC transporter permease [Actinomycetia bacterium]|nr:ABC transporter permease [Actinomycetes bacterium]MCP3911162.1 ABC transporter permease [Actinomycetes bacterium]
MTGPKPANNWLDSAMAGTRSWLREVGGLQPLYVPLYAILLSFIVGGVLITLIGVNPFEAYWALLRGMFGSGDRIAASIARSVPFIGSALALAFAFRAGLFNIGAEGQLLVGGLTAAWVGTWAFLTDVPGIVAIPVILLAGAFGGFVWGGIPGALRAKTGAHEVISTIMLNSIGLFMVRWLVSSRDPVILRDLDSTVPRTQPITDTGVLPQLVDSEPNLHWGLFLMVALAVSVAFLLNRTTFGFEINTVGTNPHAANYAGINVNRIIILAMALSGAWAGIAAASEVSGTNQFFQPGTFAFMGFDGIAIALLARSKPIAIIPAALLWGSLLAGAPLMQQEADVSIDVVRIIQSMVLLFVAADAIVRYLFRVKGQSGSPIEAATTGGTT